MFTRSRTFAKRDLASKNRLKTRQQNRIFIEQLEELSILVERLSELAKYRHRMTEVEHETRNTTR